MNTNITIDSQVAVGKAQHQLTEDKPEFEALPIDDKLIQEHIEYSKNEYGSCCSEDEARKELENLKTKGCLLHLNCQKCPKFGKCCPL